MMLMQQRMRISLMNKISLAFKKLLGNGRAWMCIDQFTSEFIDVMTDAVAEVVKKISNLKLVHFPTKTLNENDIQNGEELFKLLASGTLEERAANVENQWRAFAGSHTFQQIENILKGMGFDVTVTENVPNDIPSGAGVYGNSILNNDNTRNDPAQLNNGKHTFIVETNNLDDTVIINLVDAIVKIKPAHNVFMLLYKFLAKENNIKVGVTIQESITTKYDCTNPL